jgi:ribonuclease-3 family protein
MSSPQTFSFEGFALPKTYAVADVCRIPARSLAYIGDSVFELEMRLRHLARSFPGEKNLHGSMVKVVNADNQSSYYDQIYEQASDAEKELLRNWKNAKLPRKQLSMHRTTYARSTAFEAWIAFLFLTGQRDRLNSLIQQVFHEAHATPSPLPSPTPD